jgi:hypothetical protein
MLANVKAFKLRIEELAASSETLKKTMRDTFTEGFSGFLTDVMTGTKSLKDAFLDFARSVEQAISRIVAQNIAQSLFGASGPLGGIASFFAGLFGGSPGTGTPISGARADGGPVAANQAYLVGERGPEIFKPSVPGTIVPNEQLRANLSNSPALRMGTAALASLMLAPMVATASQVAGNTANVASPSMPIVPRIVLPAGSPFVQAVAARLQTPLPLSTAAALPPSMAAPLPPTLAAGIANRLAAVAEPAEMVLKTEQREREMLDASAMPVVSKTAQQSLQPRVDEHMQSSSQIVGAVSRSLSLSIAGSLQEGGVALRNQAYVVGERGPEIFIPATNGTVLANKGTSSNAPSVVINNTFAAGTDLRTIDQASTQIGLRVQRALRRNA